MEGKLAGYTAKQNWQVKYNRGPQTIHTSDPTIGGQQAYLRSPRVGAPQSSDACTMKCPVVMEMPTSPIPTWQGK